MNKATQLVSGRSDTCAQANSKAGRSLTAIFFKDFACANSKEAAGVMLNSSVSEQGNVFFLK